MQYNETILAKSDRPISVLTNFRDTLYFYTSAEVRRRDLFTNGTAVEYPVLSIDDLNQMPENSSDPKKSMQKITGVYFQSDGNAFLWTSPDKDDTLTQKDRVFWYDRKKHENNEKDFLIEIRDDAILNAIPKARYITLIFIKEGNIIISTHSTHHRLQWNGSWGLKDKVEVKDIPYTCTNGKAPYYISEVNKIGCVYAAHLNGGPIDELNDIQLIDASGNLIFDVSSDVIFNAFLDCTFEGIFLPNPVFSMNAENKLYIIKKFRKGSDTFRSIVTIGLIADKDGRIKKSDKRPVTIFTEKNPEGRLINFALMQNDALAISEYREKDNACVIRKVSLKDLLFTKLFKDFGANSPYFGYVPLSENDVKGDENSCIKLITTPNPFPPPDRIYYSTHNGDLATSYNTKCFESYVNSTKKCLDISTLWFYKDNAQEEILKNFINTFDNNRKESIIVRLLFSPPAGVPKDGIDLTAEDVFKYLGGENCKKNKVHLFVGRIDGSNLGRFVWNHSKILSVDNEKVITGGINFVGGHLAYEKFLVNDISMEIIHTDAARYASEYIIDIMQYSSQFAFYDYKTEKMGSNREGGLNLYGKIDNSELRKKFPEKPHDHYLLMVGKPPEMEFLGEDKNDVSSRGIIQMLNMAQDTIFIAQQSWFYYIPGVGKKSFSFNEQVEAAIAQALLRKVKVNIILSQTGEIKKEEGGYNNACGIEIVCDALKKKVGDEKWEAVKKNLLIIPAAQKPVCAHASPYIWDKTYNEHVGEQINKTSNHTPLHYKVIIVDSTYVYVGSENIYYNKHAEYGVIIKSKIYGEYFKASIWDTLFKESNTNPVVRRP